MDANIENPPHYSKYSIEPKEYIMKNGLGWCEGNVIKYITRWKDKGGVEDLNKAREFISILIDNTLACSSTLTVRR